MEESKLPQILTPAEIADYLKVSMEVVLGELDAGNLHGFKVGEEWRSTDTGVLEYISNKGASSRNPKLLTAEQSKTADKSIFVEIEPFDYQWPASVEHFEYGYETSQLINGRTYTFKIGFTDREAAGQLRRRAIVWRDNWPLVEFAGSNNYESDGMLASIIKLKNGKQLRPSEKLPDDYRNFQIGRYDSIVQGPHASRNMAVIVDKSDLESMLRHAIIRGKWKNLL